MRIAKIHNLVSSLHNMDRFLNRKAVPIYREHHGSAALADLFDVLPGFAKLAGA